MTNKITNIIGRGKRGNLNSAADSKAFLKLDLISRSNGEYKVEIFSYQKPFALAYLLQINHQHASRFSLRFNTVILFLRIMLNKLTKIN